jgi:hypothetical protein
MIGGSMKSTLLSLFLATLTLLVPSVAAQTTPATPLNGTWSGNWTPKGGVPDAVTVEIKQDSTGKLTGKFLTPTQMDFDKASFIAKTGTLTLEATDTRGGKHYKLEGKVEGTEVKGTLTNEDKTGDVRLIKWTFFGR